MKAGRFAMQVQALGHARLAARGNIEEFLVPSAYHACLCHSTRI